jgi:predicted DNA-binding protein (MmcQ/YjbR family)
MDLDSLRTLCLSFPGASEGVKWEDHICFMVAEKMFCITGKSGSVSFKVTPPQFYELIEREGIVPTPYMARNKWVTIKQFGQLRTSEWKQYITGSYNLISSRLPKKVQTALK